MTRPSTAAVALILVLALTCATAPAADVPAGRSTSAEAKKDARQAKWLTSFPNAAGQARKEDKLIMAYFRGSDWCDFCKKLDRDVLSTDLFIDWAEKNVVLLDVDFPAEKRQSPSQKKHNDALKDR